MIIEKLVLDNIRSIRNVGSILRTCDGYGIGSVICCGTTPYPAIKDDPRLPHIIKRHNFQIHKTALGAELSIDVRYYQDASEAIEVLRHQGYRIIALENAAAALDIRSLPIDNSKACLIVGHEIDGISAGALAKSDLVVKIPMSGHKSSFNVAVAAGIALERLSFQTDGEPS